jgi:hypothetical protein
MLLPTMLARLKPSPLSLFAASSLAFSLPESYDPSPRRVSPRTIPTEAGYMAWAFFLLKALVDTLFRLEDAEEPAVE